MAEYHKYVFNEKNRQFVGQFENMYQEEQIKGFDSWHQEDSRKLSRKISHEILSRYNFKLIIDIGSGKGDSTHLLKKHNNLVVGFDISRTAVSLARSRFPDIIFEEVDANDINTFTARCEDIVSRLGDGIDLVYSAECLSYIEQWRKLVESLSCRTKYLMIVLYIPNNPIGFVKSRTDLENCIRQYFDIVELVEIKTTSSIIIYAQSQKNKYIES